MDSDSDRTAALMSIHPRFADQIIQGSKRVEFRRARFASHPTFIVIYATAPVQKVLGFFEVDGIEEAPPSVLWSRYKSIGGISDADYRAYYRGAKIGIAIRVGTVHALGVPIDLRDLAGDTAPPQSFRYLNREVLPRIGLDPATYDRRSFALA